MSAPRPDWGDPQPRRLADTARMVAFVALGWALPLVIAAHIGLALR